MSDVESKHLKWKKLYVKSSKHSNRSKVRILLRQGKFDCIPVLKIKRKTHLYVLVEVK